MILAGDIGGTNARRGLFELSGKRLEVLATKTYPSRQHAERKGAAEKNRN